MSLDKPPSLFFLCRQLPPRMILRQLVLKNQGSAAFLPFSCHCLTRQLLLLRRCGCPRVEIRTFLKKDVSRWSRLIWKGNRSGRAGTACLIPASNAAVYRAAGLAHRSSVNDGPLTVSAFLSVLWFISSLIAAVKALVASSMVSFLPALAPLATEIRIGTLEWATIAVLWLTAVSLLLLFFPCRLRCQHLLPCSALVDPCILEIRLPLRSTSLA